MLTGLLADKEKEIKEITVRGLEPQLERMLAKQREEKAWISKCKWEGARWHV